MIGGYGERGFVEGREGNEGIEFLWVLRSEGFANESRRISSPRRSLKSEQSERYENLGRERQRERDGPNIGNYFDQKMSSILMTRERFLG